MITMGFFNQPRDDKVGDGGDDAWFITNSVFLLSVLPMV